MAASVVLCLSACGAPSETGSTGAGGGADETAAVTAERVSLNPMVLSLGFARGPEGDEVVKLEEGWQDRISDTNEGLPFGFPQVQYKYLTVAELKSARAEELGVVLEEVQEQTGIGPWEQVEGTGSSGCGPTVSGHRGKGRNIGSAPTISMKTSVVPTDEQFFEVIEILDRYYPGIAQPKNQFRAYDELGHRAYEMLSDDDTLVQAVYIAGGTGMSVTIYGGCFLTRDGVAWALGQNG